MDKADLVERAERFARERHEGQFRKGAAREPYITHVEEVAGLVRAFGGSDEAVAAAWLHDTVEDCPPTSHGEIARLFGAQVASIVGEVTDDTSLPKAERKQLQVTNARKKSEAGSLIKLADKTSNLRAITNSPPPDWNLERRMAYLRWAAEVIFNLPHKPIQALDAFLSALDQCELAIAASCLPPSQAENVALEVMNRRALRSSTSTQQADEFLGRFVMAARAAGDR